MSVISRNAQIICIYTSQRQITYIAYTKHSSSSSGYEFSVDAVPSSLCDILTTWIITAARQEQWAKQEEISMKCGGERQCSMKYRPSLRAPKCYYPSRGLWLILCEYVPVFLWFLLLLLCSTTASGQKTTNTLLTWKVKHMRKPTDGFLWSQKGEHRRSWILGWGRKLQICEEKIIIIIFQDLKWEDCGRHEVPWCTLGLHVSNA